MAACAAFMLAIALSLAGVYFVAPKFLPSRRSSKLHWIVAVLERLELMAGRFQQFLEYFNLDLR